MSVNANDRDVPFSTTTRWTPVDVSSRRSSSCSLRRRNVQTKSSIEIRIGRRWGCLQALMHHVIAHRLNAFPPIKVTTSRPIVAMKSSRVPKSPLIGCVMRFTLPARR